MRPQNGLCRPLMILDMVKTDSGHWNKNQILCRLSRLEMAWKRDCVYFKELDHTEKPKSQIPTLDRNTFLSPQVWVIVVTKGGVSIVVV